MRLRLLVRACVHGSIRTHRPGILPREGRSARPRETFYTFVNYPLVKPIRSSQCHKQTCVLTLASESNSNN